MCRDAAIYNGHMGDHRGMEEPAASCLLVTDASLSGFGGEVFDLRSGQPVLVGVLRERFPRE
jgi:hypothetical protein